MSGPPVVPPTRLADAKVANGQAAAVALDLLDEFAPNLSFPIRCELDRIRRQTARYRSELRSAETEILELKAKIPRNVQRRNVR